MQKNMILITLLFFSLCHGMEPNTLLKFIPHHPITINFYAKCQDNSATYHRMAQRRYLDFLTVIKLLFPRDSLAGRPYFTHHNFNAGNLCDPFAPVMLKIVQEFDITEYAFCPKTGLIVKEKIGTLCRKKAPLTHPEKYAWHCVPFKGFGDYALKE